MKHKIIGLTGTRGVGKDTMFHLLQSLDPRFTRYAFADKLKNDLFTLVFNQFGYDMNHLTQEQKEIIRHLLIGYGMSWRAADELHWVKEVDAQIQHDLKWSDKIPVITDFRFENEVKFFQDKYKEEFYLINLARVDAPEPTDEEKKHFEKVCDMSQHRIIWGEDTEQERIDFAKLIYNELSAL